MLIATIASKATVHFFFASPGIMFATQFEKDKVKRDCSNNF